MRAVPAGCPTNEIGGKEHFGGEAEPAKDGPGNFVEIAIPIVEGDEHRPAAHRTPLAAMLLHVGGGDGVEAMASQEAHLLFEERRCDAVVGEDRGPSAATR